MSNETLIERCFEIGWLISGLACLASSGCAHRPDTGSSPRLAHEEGRVETERAFELERRANLVIEYERANVFLLRTPGQNTHIRGTDESLPRAIVNATPRRELAVVIIGKPVHFEFPEPQLRSKMDEIEAVIRAQGFTHVVIQMVSASGRSVYR